MIAGTIGVVFELLIAMRGKDGKQRFGWIPVASALGFALILPPSITLALAFGSVISAAWRKFWPKKDGSYELFAAPLAAGLIAGEAMVGAILLPVLGALYEIVKPYL